MPTESLAAVFFFAMAVSFGAVISPGPVSAAIVSEAPRQGWRVGPLVASGHAIMELLMVVLIAVGLSAGMASPGVQKTIALAGGLLLIGIGLSYLRAVWRGEIRLPDAQHSAPQRTQSALLGLGILTTASNPFWYAWWVTVVPSYLSQARLLGTSAIVVFYLGHILTDFAWNSILSTATGAGRRLLTDRRYQILMVITGGFMCYLGVIFIRSAFVRL